MSINNGDMPAMPLTGDAYTNFANFDGTSNTSYDPQCQGLTKREEMAMHQDSSDIKCDVMFIGDFIGRVVDLRDPIDLMMAEIESQAKIKVMKADALLKELSK